MHLLKTLFAVALALVLVLPLLNAVALAKQSRGRMLLHLAHMDAETHPNRETRRGMSPLLGRSVYVVEDAGIITVAQTKLKRAVALFVDRVQSVAACETGAVTLAQAKLNVTDDIDVQVIDEFRKQSYLLDNITFDDAVNPAGGGATLTYGYTRLTTQPTAQFRAINAEFVPAEVQKARFTVDLKPFGGSFEIDRVLSKLGRGAEVTLQMRQKIKAARALFHDTAINGDTAVDANAFDGLNKALVGTTTEYGAAAGPPLIDISTSALMDSNGHAFLDLLDDFLGLLDEKPTFIGTHQKLRNKIISIARRLGYKTQAEDAFGRKIASYDGIPVIDLGEKPGSSTSVVPIYTVGAVTGMTDLYAVRLGLDAFHGVSLAGEQLVQTWMPDFTRAGAVKKGEVEMVSAVALKATKAAGVMRRIKVQ